MTAGSPPDQFPELEAALPGLVLRPFREADAPAVAEKAGFEFEGIMRNAGIVHGGRVDLCLYALIPGPAADGGTPA